MTWPSLAAHSRASLAESLATVTPVLTRPDARDRPDPRELRTVLYQHAFNPARPAEPGGAAAQILGWAQQASLPVGCFSEPTVLPTALEAPTLRLDGSRAAGQPGSRQHHHPQTRRPARRARLRCRGRAAAGQLDSFSWQVPRSSAALDPAVGWSRSPGAGRLASHAPRRLRHRPRRPTVPGNPRRAAQRIGLRPFTALAIRRR